MVMMMTMKIMLMMIEEDVYHVDNDDFGYGDDNVDDVYHNNDACC